MFNFNKLVFLIFLISSISSNSQVIINEVMFMPGTNYIAGAGGDNTNSAFQSMYNTTLTGQEWIELYNPDPCNSIDLSCYIIGANTTSSNQAAFALPVGTIIPPLGFLILGGVNAPNVDINLSTLVGTSRHIGTSRWHLENGCGYVLLANPSGVIQDAVYWSQNNAADLIAATTCGGSFDNILNVPSICNASLTTLPQARDIAGIEYAGNFGATAQGPTVIGKSLQRDNDGSMIWVLSSTGGTPKACNGVCAVNSSVPTPIINSIPPTCIAEGSSTISNYNVGNIYIFTPAGPTVGAGGLISGMIVGTSYTLTATSGTCTSAASLPFSNLAQLTIPLQPTFSTSLPTCLSDGISTITNYNGTFTYTFTPAGPTVGAGGVISGMTIGISYTVTAGNGSCTSVSSASFTNLAILPVPSQPTISTTAPTCSSDGISTITNYDGSLTYTFTPAGPTTGAGGLISGMAVGTNYTVTSSNGSCSSIASASFSNLASLVTLAVPTITTTAPTCSADGFSQISNYDSSNTYTFTPAGPTVGAGGAIGGMIVGTSYTVTATNGGCTSLASASFSNAAQLPTPAVPTISITAPTCSSDGVSTITNYDGSLTYTFTPAGPTTGAGGLISGMIVGTSYTVTASNGSCSSVASASFSNAAMLNTPAIATASVTVQPTCPIPTGTIEVSAPIGATLEYSIDGGATYQSSTTFSGLPPNTSYTIIVRDSSTGCTSSTSGSIIVDSVPPSPIVSTVSGCNGASFEITASVDLGTATFEWYDSSSNLIGTTATVIVTSSGTYEVRATVNSCTTIEFVTIELLPCVIPKGVSPNEDGLNDTWDLSGLNAKNVQIFNRYGVEVYSKSNYTNEWEGKTNSGDELPSATYYYVVSLPSGEVKTGWVYINREN